MTTGITLCIRRRRRAPPRRREGSIAGRRRASRERVGEAFEEREARATALARQGGVAARRRGPALRVGDGLQDERAQNNENDEGRGQDMPGLARRARRFARALEPEAREIRGAGA